MSRNIRLEKIYRLPVSPEQDDELDLSQGILQSLNEFDRNGNLLLEITYNEDGSILEKNEYRYNEAGAIIASIIYGEFDEPLETRKIYRDEKGMVIKEEITYLDSSVDIIHHHYKNNILAEKIQTTEDEEVETREVYQYEDNKLILFEKYNENDEMVYQLRNIFKDGKPVESQVWSTEDTEPFRQIIYYNDEGRRMEELRYDKRDKLIERNLYEENEAGLVARVIEENMARKNTTELTYDENGNLLRQVETDMNGKIISELERSYDQEGMPEAIRSSRINRITGMTQEVLLVYEYDFFE